MSFSPPTYDDATNPSSKRNENGNDPRWGRANPYVAPIMIDVNINNIESYMGWSILNIFCCCLCFGLLACFYSSETNDAKIRGDILGALNASRKARTINIIATILGIIITINYVVFLTGNY